MGDSGLCCCVPCLSVELCYLPLFVICKNDDDDDDDDDDDP